MNAYCDMYNNLTGKGMSHEEALHMISDVSGLGSEEINNMVEQFSKEQ